MVWFAAVDLVAGWLAGVLMNGSGFGLVGDLVVGLLGGLLGGFLFRVLGISAGGFLGSVIVATVGAVVCRRRPRIAGGPSRGRAVEGHAGGVTVDLK